MATNRIERAWQRASRAERISFLAEVAGELVSAGEQADTGSLLRWSGPRPTTPSLRTPHELVELVLVQGHTLAAAARVVGCSARTIRRWWSGSNGPQKRHLVALRAAVTRRSDALKAGGTMVDG